MKRHALALLIVAIASATTAAAEPRVGFVNAARGGHQGRDAIGILRSQLQARGGFTIAPPNAALEDPIGHSDAAELAGLISAARTDFVEFRFDAATRKLDRAEAAVAGGWPQATTIPSLIEIELLRAEVAHAQGKTKAALAAFARVHRLDPERIELDERRYSPPLRALFTKARQDRAAVEVEIRATPSGSQVWVDGRDVGMSPVKAKVPAGPGYLMVASPGYAPRLRAVEFGARASAVIELERLSDVEGAWAVRKALQGASNAEAATLLARLKSKVDVLVVVRERGQALEAAVFEVAPGRLGPWRPARAAELFGGSDAEGADRSDLFARGPAREPRPWYGTGWGKGLIIGGAVATAVGTTLLIFALRDDGPAYRVGDFNVR